MTLNLSKTLFFFSFIFINNLFANTFVDKNITGVITDINNIPLPYASVVVDGTSLGTNSNLDGVFSIYLPDGNYTLTISYLGYQDEKKVIPGESFYLMEAYFAPDMMRLNYTFWNFLKKDILYNGKKQSQLGFMAKELRMRKIKMVNTFMVLLKKRKK
ncbi:carboxypeptidase-like regulatory domain-containing protein [Flavivirga rizhaonensis]|uniref:Carboxypeptidase-like regulatory domain-containing protein n=1 Tax=Flavivirga rizhaonensis TaxID=2559571 RepID=A0A4V3P523_9FLAO|nr:carboxypeptidase-like regulatory domain-containing protein [Flavivirga rizhaonensis]TGV03574.1 carboxypeptidase-like regulatory domain-containing protein [Flavivirga rizhaonensis]